MTTRRRFLTSSAALLAGSPLLGACASAAREASQTTPAEKPLSILVLGGTGFIGPHQIETALARGHEVTMFNRGNNAGLFGDRVEELIGDRDANVNAGLSALEGNRRWDVVIDNSGYVPRHVRDSAELLRERCEQYLYVSTVAVYDYANAPLQDDIRVADVDAPLHPAPEPFTERVTGATYGPLKAEGDRIVQEIYGERGTVVRPCYIVGPGDTTDRFTYWVERLMRGGDVVCPAHPDRPMQWIDVRDLCNFIVHLIEGRTSGIFNGVGPASLVTNQEGMQGLRAFCSEPIRLWWPSPADLEAARFATPMFDPNRLKQWTDPRASVPAGLTYRSLADTVRDTHAWWLEQSEERRANPRRWPSPEAEQAVLDRLRA
ncbi:MAG: NAD-dependent epimerase/dehydratase family protein [Planctomycetota bacterium]|jgi:2'-hydroxyisoflavone reductase